MSTLQSDTVQNILQIIADLRGEASVSTDASRIRAISRANQDFANRRLWRFYLLDDQTTTANGSTTDFTIGSASYPMRYKGLAEVFVGGTTEDKRYQIVDFIRYKNQFNQNNASQLAYEWYDATNDLWKMHVNPTPSNGTTITYSYFWSPPVLTLTSDKVVCPNTQVIALNSLADIYHGEEELQKEQLARQQAEQLIGDLEGVDNMPGVNQSYAMGAIENMTKNRGIGTY